tara:strand:- start:1247 stop:3739 length:2493 start_codon:yes stop_codon:yes gene_type:complete
MPTRREGEEREDFISRCMSDDKMNTEYPERDQRFAICNSYADDKAVEALQYGKPKKNDPRKTPAKPSERRKGSKKNKKDSASKPNKSIKISKETEARIRKLMTESNKKNKGPKASMGMLKSVFRRGAGAFSNTHAPNMSRTGWGIARVKAFLYLMRNGRPSNPNYKQDNDLLPKSHKRKSNSKAGEEMEEYEDWGVTAKMEDYIFMEKEQAEKKSREMGFDGVVHTTKTADGQTLYFPGPNEEEFQKWYRENDEGDELDASAAEYQGRKVTLNKPFRTPKESKKFAVYTKNASGNVVIVRFGDPNMEIKRDDPERRKSFRSRHNCKSPGPKWKARYWSCKMWERGKSVTDYTSSEQHIYETEENLQSMGCGCGCDGSDEKATAEEIGQDMFSTPEEARTRAEELGCNSIHSMEQDGKRIYMPCRTHEEYDSKKDNDNTVEGYKHGDSCPPGQEMRGGSCKPIAVTLEIDITSIETSVVAEDGKSVVTIKGIAFHEGYNKNRWSISADLAESVASAMINSDITLNHPAVKNGRFTRNMDGGVDEAVVGVVTDAYVNYTGEDTFEVHFAGDVLREELFASLESGLWLREGYGVSIGGTGIPDETLEAEDGRPMYAFNTNFNFDHLAIVHKPAYDRAKITSVEKKEKEISATVIYGRNNPMVSKTGELPMSEENTVIANEEDTHDVEALIAEKVLLEARVAEFERIEQEKAESERTSLVEKASELGMKGHEDLSTDTLNGLIASWEESHVEETPIVDMKPVKASTPDEEESPSVPTANNDAVVANFLNKERIETPEADYERAYNMWVSAWNRTLSRSESDFRAKSFEEVRGDY